MGDLEHLRQDFLDLLRGLSETWPSQDVDYVREEVGHGEYGDALENFVALGSHNGMHFDEQQSRKIESLAARMDMLGSAFLSGFRQTT